MPVNSVDCRKVGRSSNIQQTFGVIYINIHILSLSLSHTHTQPVIGDKGSIPLIHSFYTFLKSEISVEKLGKYFTQSQKTLGTA